MESKVNYIVVGLFVIALGVALTLLALWLSMSTHKDYVTYAIYMDEAVDGLSEQAPVRFNGVDVGFVKDIRLNPKDPQQVCLLVDIDENAPINQSTVATLKEQGITGVTYIGLTAKAATAPPLQILPGEEYPIIKYVPSLIVELTTTLRDVGSGFRKLNKTLQTLLGDGNQKAISDSLANIAKITQTFANNSPEIDASLKSTNRLLQQSIPGLVESIGRLTSTLPVLEQFIIELENNPSILIRGKAAQNLGPGE